MKLKKKTNFNLGNFLIAILAFLPLFITIDYKTSTMQNSLVYVLVPIFIIFVGFHKFPSQQPIKYDLTYKDSLAALGIDFICWTGIILVVTIVGNIISSFFGLNTVIVILYFILLSRVFYKSFGFMALHFDIPNQTIKDKLKLLAINYLTIFPATAQQTIRTRGWPENIGNIIFTYWLAFIFANFLSKVLFLKSQTFLERLFHIYSWKEDYKSEDIIFYKHSK